MLAFSGVLIGLVLVAMTGNTVRMMQVVGWLPIHATKHHGVQMQQPVDPV